MSRKKGLRLMVSCMKNTCEVICEVICTQVFLESKFFFIENFYWFCPFWTFLWLGNSAYLKPEFSLTWSLNVPLEYYISAISRYWTLCPWSSHISHITDLNFDRASQTSHISHIIDLNLPLTCVPLKFYMSAMSQSCTWWLWNFTYLPYHMYELWLCHWYFTYLAYHWLILWLCLWNSTYLPYHSLVLCASEISHISHITCLNFDGASVFPHIWHIMSLILRGNAKNYPKMLQSCFLKIAISQDRVDVF